MITIPATALGRLAVLALLAVAQDMDLSLGIATGDSREAYEDWLEVIGEGELSAVEHEFEDLLMGHE